MTQSSCSLAAQLHWSNILVDRAKIQFFFGRSELKIDFELSQLYLGDFIFKKRIGLQFNLKPTISDLRLFESDIIQFHFGLGKSKELENGRMKNPYRIYRFLKVKINPKN